MGLTPYTKYVSAFLEWGFLRRCLLQKNVTDVRWEQIPLIEYINKHPDCTQIDIATALKLTPAAVTLSTQKLEKQGIITKHTDSENLRCKKLRITEAGRQCLEKGSEIFDCIDNITFEGFNDEELDILGDYVRRINNNLAKAAELKGHFKLPWEFSKTLEERETDSI